MGRAVKRSDKTPNKQRVTLNAIEFILKIERKKRAQKGVGYRKIVGF